MLTAQQRISILSTLLKAPYAELSYYSPSDSLYKYRFAFYRMPIINKDSFEIIIATMTEPLLEGVRIDANTGEYTWYVPRDNERYNGLTDKIKEYYDKIILDLWAITC